MIIWAALILIKRILDFIIYDYYKFDVLATIKSVLSPILEILAMQLLFMY